MCGLGASGINRSNYHPNPYFEGFGAGGLGDGGLGPGPGLGPGLFLTGPGASFHPFDIFFFFDERFADFLCAFFEPDFFFPLLPSEELFDFEELRIHPFDILLPSLLDNRISTINVANKSVSCGHN